MVDLGVGFAGDEGIIESLSGGSGFKKGSFPANGIRRQNEVV